MSTRAPSRMLLLLGAIVLLLPLLAFLQYRWLGQVSVAERERMRAVLQSSAAQFGETFDREITRAYSIFQYRQASEVSRWGEEFAGRFQEWETGAAYPQMVRELCVIVADEAGVPQWLRFNKAARQFEPAPWPNEFKDLSSQTNRTRFDYILEEPLALVIPPEDAFPPKDKTGLLCTVVLLDLDHIQEAIFPALAERYFAANNELQYDLTIVSPNTAENVIFQTRPGLLPNAAKSDAVTGLFDVRLETLLGGMGKQETKVRGAAPEPGAFVRVVKRRVGPGQEEEKPGRWRLLVQHRAGSLEEAVANGRRRNLAISFGVLLLLGVCVGIIALSSERATRLAQEQIKFVAGVSHELRTPLAVICSAGENLADGVVSAPDQVAEYGGLIRNEGRRLSQMVEQVLEYAGAESGRQNYRLQPTDLREVLEAAVRGCRQQIEESGFQCETDLEPNLPRVNADASALQRALQNLLGNAIKYDGGKKRVALRARAAGNEMLITVEDHGRGIVPADLPHVFEPFYRGQDVVSAQIKGNGLGLSLVRHIIAAHGGRVSVESTPGQGSSFTLHLPIAPGAGPPSGRLVAQP